MASQAVSIAVEARIAANWTRTPVVPVNGQGAAAEVPADGSPYLVVQYPIGVENQMSIGAPGNNVWREEGTIRFVLHAQRGADLAPAMGWLDELRALFRGATFDGVQCWGASPPVENDENDRGLYYVISSSVAYEYDVTG